MQDDRARDHENRARENGDCLTGTREIRTIPNFLSRSLSRCRCPIPNPDFLLPVCSAHQMHFRKTGGAERMQYLRSILARFRAWQSKRRLGTSVGPSLLLSFGPSIHRDVTPNGVRVYSLCGGCGARLECSATLCQECAA